MACEYYSRNVWEQFTDAGALERALNRIGRAGFNVAGLEVSTRDRGRMNELRQAYQTEAAKAALKKKGFFVSETRDRQTGKITLKVTGGR